MWSHMKLYALRGILHHAVTFHRTLHFLSIRQMQKLLIKELIDLSETVEKTTHTRRIHTTVKTLCVKSVVSALNLTIYLQRLWTHCGEVGVHAPACMQPLAHALSCWETSGALVAAAGTGGLKRLLAGPLLCSGPKEELQESSFVSSSSTYLTCLHSRQESLRCWILTSLFLSFLCLFFLSLVSLHLTFTYCFFSRSSKESLCHAQFQMFKLLWREEADHCIITNAHN